eukprot:TRINITY_DN10466_c0_g1_i1.p1 TRINITY_DN10466_c0_g1~~TRINITY_DN10466_c0_g1_i1.p1  ORF type:complete len:148 (+),score=18.10 TRINITY_DN10466_c0_g1_i1:124-567(+)
MILYILLVNKQGQTRLSKYYQSFPKPERLAMEGEIVRRCLSRSENQCSFMEYKTCKVVYRRYAGLFFIVGIDEKENELAILEFIHLFVETLDSYFSNVCELDIMFNLDRAHVILDEIVLNGSIIECNKKNILETIQVIDDVEQSGNK